ncbi:MAG: glycoside hydrolase family 18 protein [Bacilli bacterium]|nr:glycoside hydrolase family 18 protein [Bacilli bacterium]
MKKVLIILVFIFSLLTLSACVKEEVIDIDQDKVDEVVYYIDDLPKNIRISDKDSVIFIMAMYDELNDDEKKLVDNYQKLLDAYNKINAIENEDSLMNSYLQEACEDILNNIPDVIDNTKWSLGIDDEYEYKNEYVSYTFLVSIGSDNESIITSNGKVYHDNLDVTVDVNIEVSYRTYNYSGSKKVKVLADNFKNLNQGQVIIAYCYEYTGIREADLHTIDIVNYCFAQIRENNNGFYIDISELSQINRIKELHAAGIRVCMSIGGWRDDSDDWIPYQKASKTEEGRKQVANAILDIMERYELDGIDMDWEYPRSDDKNNFTLLMKEIRDTLKAKNQKYIISAAVPSSLNTRRYDYVALNEILDYFNVMTYDMETSSNTSYQSALYTSSYSRYSTDDAVKSIINAGVDKRKVVLGMAFYGKKYTNVGNNNMGRGEKYGSKIYITYTEIYNNYLSKGIESYYDSNAGSNYIYDEANKVFICYEDEETIKAKCEYAISKDIGGIMWWSYENDKTGTLMSYLDDMYNKLKHIE